MEGLILFLCVFFVCLFLVKVKEIVEPIRTEV